MQNPSRRRRHFWRFAWPAQHRHFGLRLQNNRCLILHQDPASSSSIRNGDAPKSITPENEIVQFLRLLPQQFTRFVFSSSSTSSSAKVFKYPSPILKYNHFLNAVHAQVHQAVLLNRSRRPLQSQSRNGSILLHQYASDSWTSFTNAAIRYISADTKTESIACVSCTMTRFYDLQFAGNLGNRRLFLERDRESLVLHWKLQLPKISQLLLNCCYCCSEGGKNKSTRSMIPDSFLAFFPFRRSDVDRDRQ
jgi:hypothetical protein